MPHDKQTFNVLARDYLIVQRVVRFCNIALGVRCRRGRNRPSSRLGDVARAVAEAHRGQCAAGLAVKAIVGVRDVLLDVRLDGARLITRRSLRAEAAATQRRVVVGRIEDQLARHRLAACVRSRCFDDLRVGLAACHEK